MNDSNSFNLFNKALRKTVRIKHIIFIICISSMILFLMGFIYANILHNNQISIIFGIISLLLIILTNVTYQRYFKWKSFYKHMLTLELFFNFTQLSKNTDTASSSVNLENISE